MVAYDAVDSTARGVERMITDHVFLTDFARSIESLFVAPTGLWCTDVSATEVDGLWVQGRQDRVHVFRRIDAIDDSLLDETLGEIAAAPANWAWCVVDGLGEAQLLSRSASFGVGVIARSEGVGWSIEEKSQPKPGIFLRHYPVAYERWRTLSRW